MEKEKETLGDYGQQLIQYHILQTNIILVLQKVTRIPNEILAVKGLSTCCWVYIKRISPYFRERSYKNCYKGCEFCICPFFFNFKYYKVFGIKYSNQDDDKYCRHKKQQAVLQDFSDLAWYPPCIKKLFHFFHILFVIKSNLLLNYFQIQCSLFTKTSYMYMYMYHYDSVPCTYKKFIL